MKSPAKKNSDGMTGVERAAKHLRKKRKANKAIPDLGVISRQMRRAQERQAAKGTPSRDSNGTFYYA